MTDQRIRKRNRLYMSSPVEPANRRNWTASVQYLLDVRISRQNLYADFLTTGILGLIFSWLKLDDPSLRLIWLAACAQVE